MIESGKLKPVWFENIGKSSADRIFIKEICSTWTHHQGSAKIWNFAVTAGGNGYRLALNTEAFTWELGVVEETEFPSARTANLGSYRQRE